MARAPDSRIAPAKELYLAGEKLIEIARQLGLPEGTVRRWKCTHKWDKADTERSDRKGSEKSERSGKKTKRRRGAQPGNKNSAGGPPGNKKAVTTGEYEALLFDCLEECCQTKGTVTVKIHWGCGEPIKQLCLGQKKCRFRFVWI